MQSLLFEKPTKWGGFEGANDIHEQGSQVATFWSYTAKPPIADKSCAI
jgi:hypothetical protein